MGKTRSIHAIHLMLSFFLALLLGCLAIVFIINSNMAGFHGYLPEMSKERILSLRTALASLSIFTCFPLIWAVNRRGGKKDSRALGWTFLALSLALSPSLYGLTLFLLKGAFKTFFAFFVLSVFYMLIALPR